MGHETAIRPRATPVHRSVRRLRWFIESFHKQAERTSAETGVSYAIDDETLTRVFVAWLRAFEAQKPDAPEDRLPYVGFAAGLMLRTLIDKGPVHATALPQGADSGHPAYFWPEGYLYVAYCLNVRALVLEQDFHEKQATVPELSEARTWWSFRENVAEDPSLAIGFLDLFAGEDPDWSTPDIFHPGRARRIARQFYREMNGPSQDPEA
jgi:hypothetical protein